MPAAPRPLLAATLTFGLGCAPGPEAEAEVRPLEVPAGCPRYASPVKQGTVNHRALNEVSGLVASRTQPGVLWVHNDSGDRPRAFALATDGALLGEYRLSGANAIDWEDMALGPGPEPGVDYLYLGDIGDNFRVRPAVQVYRIREPAVATGRGRAGQTHEVERVERFRLRYPDGAHNAETLLVDPADSALYIVTKEEEGPSRLYRAPSLRTDQSVELEALGDVALPPSIAPGSHLVTAGDVAPDGGAVVLRTYSTAFVYLRTNGSSLPEVLAGSACPVPLALELQGEAIAFANQNGRYLTTSEKRGQPIWAFVPEG